LVTGIKISNRTLYKGIMTPCNNYRMKLSVWPNSNILSTGMVYLLRKRGESWVLKVQEEVRFE